VRRVAIALVHYPVLDRQGATVTAAITNLDVHDIARTAMTFGVDAFYVVHPIEAQRNLVNRIREHWIEGSGGKRIPDRIAPMRLVRVVPTIDDALADFSQGEKPSIWTTSASTAPVAPPLSHAEAARYLAEPGPPVMLLFGTGWGLAKGPHALATNLLQPIASARAGSFNHLSVRAAVAIIVDRLLSECRTFPSGTHENG
jgi:hypothetical protein